MYLRHRYAFVPMAFFVLKTLQRTKQVQMMCKVQSSCKFSIVASFHTSKTAIIVPDSLRTALTEVNMVVLASWVISHTQHSVVRRQFIQFLDGGRKSWHENSYL